MKNRIQIKELTRGMREDLFNMYAMYKNPDANERLFYQNYVDVVEVDLNSIPASNFYKMEEQSLKDYLSILTKEETKYGMVASGKLMDGMHRATSLKNDKQDKMLAVDVSKYINLEETGYICDVNYNKKNTNKLKI
jgi:hypothetical protein